MINQESAHCPCIHCIHCNPIAPVTDLDLTHCPCVHCNLRAPIQFHTLTSTNNAPLTDLNTYPPISVPSTQQALLSSYPSRFKCQCLQQNYTILPHHISETSFNSAGSSHKYAYDTWSILGGGLQQ